MHNRREPRLAVVTPEPTGHQRLEDAALQLFVQQGYDQTTVEDIVRRAGLGRRTFFRHFVNKREVLFWGQAALREAHARAIAQAPPDRSPMELAQSALCAAADIMEDRYELIRMRHAVIRANVELQERELLKRSQLSAAMAGCLRDRGVDPATAEVTAAAALATFGVAFTTWAGGTSETPDWPLRDHVAVAMRQLHAAAS